MIWTPRPWQPPMVDHMTDVERNATWAGMGTGKTGTTLSALQMVQDLLDPRPALVVAPKRVAGRTWPREMEKWDHLDGECVPILGTAAERLRVLRRPNSGARLFSINYENLPWLVETLADLRKPWPFNKIIADESTKLKSYRTRQGGARAAALMKVAFDADWFWELTGTPAPNGLLDIWGQIAFVDGGQRLGRSYTAYKNRWFRPEAPTEFAKWIPQPFAEEQIFERLRDVVLSVQVPVEKPIVNKVYVDLPPKARQLYRDMEKESFAELRGVGIDAPAAASRINKCLQIASGHIYDEHKVAHHIHDAKIEALESIVEEAAGMPVLVAVNYKFETPAILRAFGGRARVLDTDRDLDDFAAGKIDVGVAHPASLGHGINDLEHGTNIYAFFSGDFNLEFHDQIIERVGPMRQKQSGYDRPVYGHYIMAEHTWDEEVFERRVEKITVQEGARRALERRT